MWSACVTILIVVYLNPPVPLPPPPQPTNTVESRYYAPPREYAPLPFSAKVPAQVFLTRTYAPLLR